MSTSSPYESLTTKTHRKDLENKSHWISEKDFNNKYNPKPATEFIETYVVRDPSQPPALHKFRNIDKKRWIGNDFFV